MNYRMNKGALITTAIIIIAIVGALGYFGINIQRDIAGNPTIQSNFSYLYDNLKWFWDSYLKNGMLILWHWTVVNITNLPVGSGNGIQIPQITYPGLINAFKATDPLNGQTQVSQ